MKHTQAASLPRCPAGPWDSPALCPSAHPQPARSLLSLLPTHFSPSLLLTTTLISHFLPAAHAHIKTSTAFTAVSQEERAWQFLSLYLSSISVFVLSLPQAILPEILAAIKEKSKETVKHLGGKKKCKSHIKLFWEHRESKLHVNLSLKVGCFKKQT